jgi:hypothetical protein
LVASGQEAVSDDYTVRQPLFACSALRHCCFLSFPVLDVDARSLRRGIFFSHGHIYILFYLVNIYPLTFELERHRFYIVHLGVNVSAAGHIA